MPRRSNCWEILQWLKGELTSSLVCPSQYFPRVSSFFFSSQPDRRPEFRISWLCHKKIFSHSRSISLKQNVQKQRQKHTLYHNKIAKVFLFFNCLHVRQGVQIVGEILQWLKGELTSSLVCPSQLVFFHGCHLFCYLHNLTGGLSLGSHG